jgi:cyclic pyranopterin phosphate synthase
VFGFIAPYGAPFCADCNRLRVSSTGGLKLCLFGDGSVPLRPLLADDSQQGALRQRIASAVLDKPAAHRLGEGHSGTTTSLAVIGG